MRCVGCQQSLVTTVTVRAYGGAVADRSPDTVTEALELLRSQGYRTNFQLIDGELRAEPSCPSCPVAEVLVDKVYRFEGLSDPGDEMIVFALVEPTTGTKGVLASAYGHSADPALSEHLAHLHRRFER